jgi:hypothetical protein
MQPLRQPASPRGIGVRLRGCGDEPAPAVPVRLLPAVKSGKARVEGDGSVLGRLRGLLVSFKPDFEIMPGARASAH